MQKITINTGHGQRDFAAQDLIEIAELLRSIRVDARVSTSEGMALETASQILNEIADDFGFKDAIVGEGM